MLSYIARRFVYMLVLLMVLSFVSFVIIQLPPGDYLTTMIENMRRMGLRIEADDIRRLEDRYGLDQPFHIQYFTWVRNLLQGDLGESFQWNRDVTDLIGERFTLTVTVTLATLFLTYIVAVPIGIYSA